MKCLPSKRRSKGAVLLALTGETIDSIAARVHVSRSLAGHFQTGARVPGPENRIALRAAYGIPLDAWDEDAKEPEGAPPGEHADRVELADVSVRSRARELESMVNAQLAAIRDPKAVISDDQRSKVMQRSAQTLLVLGKITGETLEMPEERLIRLPAMRRMKDALVRALSPWPEAMRAVGEELQRIERED